MDQAQISRIERGGDACWSTVARLYDALGYDLSWKAEPCACEDEVEDLLQHQIEERRARMEEGRAQRW